jgi:hypothetical protein
MELAFSSSSSSSTGSSSSAMFHGPACRNLASLQAAVLKTLLAMQSEDVQQQLSQEHRESLDEVLSASFLAWAAQRQLIGVCQLMHRQLRGSQAAAQHVSSSSSSSSEATRAGQLPLQQQQAAVDSIPTYHKSLLHLVPGDSQTYFDALGLTQTSLPAAAGAGAGAAAAAANLTHVIACGIPSAKLLCVHIQQQHFICDSSDSDDDEAAAAAAAGSQHVPELVSGMTPAECLQLAVELQLLTEALLVQQQQQQQQQGQEPFKLTVLLLVASNQLLQQVLQCCAAISFFKRNLQQLLSRQDVLLLLLRALATPV